MRRLKSWLNGARTRESRKCSRQGAEAARSNRSGPSGGVKYLNCYCRLCSVCEAGISGPRNICWGSLLLYSAQQWETLPNEVTRKDKGDKNIIFSPGWCGSVRALSCTPEGWHFQLPDRAHIQVLSLIPHLAHTGDNWSIFSYSWKTYPWMMKNKQT